MMTMALADRSSRPWYREPWPWLLMAGPAAVVVGGLFTAWLAVRSDDGLVAEDYYKQGLAINQVLARERAAAAYGLQARLELDPVGARVRLALSGKVPPERQLRLRFVHPTRAGADQLVTLEARADGVFEGAIAPLAEGRWLVTLEDAGRRWRLTGEFSVPAPQPVTLRAGSS
jgi:hypothetical protein